jgi:adenosylhomocysteinase
VKVLPKQLDEEVSRFMTEGFGDVITRMTEEQYKYVCLPVEGPCNPDEYRY